MAEAGWSVLGVDPHLVGGECPYYGCIPTKMMVRGAEVLAEARRVPGMAGDAQVSPDFRPVAERIRTEATDNWDDHVAVERFEGKGGTFARGAGRLVGRDDDGRLRVAVGDTTYRGRHVVIATGTAPAIPDVDGLAELRASGSGPDGPVWTNREAVKAPTAPRVVDHHRRRPDRLRAGAGVRPVRDEGRPDRARAAPVAARRAGSGRRAGHGLRARRASPCTPARHRCAPRPAATASRSPSTTARPSAPRRCSSPPAGCRISPTSVSTRSGSIRPPAR